MLWWAISQKKSPLSKKLQARRQERMEAAEREREEDIAAAGRMTGKESLLYGMLGGMPESYPNERLMEELKPEDVCELFRCNERTAREYIHTLRALFFLIPLWAGR